MDKTNLSGRNCLCCRLLRASAIAEADATMQVIKIIATLAVHLKSELIVCIHRINHDGQYHRAPLVQWLLHKYKCLWSVGGKGWGSSLEKRASATNKVSTSEYLGAIISNFFRFIDKIIVGIQV